YVPFTDIALVSVNTNSLITPFVASILALGLNEGAYMAEIVRAGIAAVDRGQVDAARALGMTNRLLMRRIVLPQALAVAIPPSVNQFTNLLKATSLVSVIAGGDLLTEAENISSANLHTIELLLVASFWFLAITSLSTLAQHLVERRLAAYLPSQHAH
ncbi:MAG: amino acid ABC transporter permease, partial [Vulcanimicrobiaceae bacterium]